MNNSSGIEYCANKPHNFARLSYSVTATSNLKFTKKEGKNKHFSLLVIGSFLI